MEEDNSGAADSRDREQKQSKATKKKQHRRRWTIFQQRLFKMVSVGVVDDFVNRAYDIISITALLLNLTVSIMMTYDSLNQQYGDIFKAVEKVTVAFFALDYVLRIITAKYLYPTLSEPKAILRYCVSFFGIIDLLSFAPYYLPVFFPGGMAAFRMIRVVRILRLFRINAYYDSLNVIGEVLKSKSKQLVSSVFIILVLMIASSLCMYSLEHKAQPDVFKDAFSGIWWSASTLLTVGYGDIYPVTDLGKAFGILITFLGVGMVAIPTGIISAGFVEQYSRLKKIGDYGTEANIHFIKIELRSNDKWVGSRIMDINLPHAALIAVIQRNGESIIPRGNVVLKAGDLMILAAESVRNDQPVNLKEMTLARENPWNGVAIKDLDISRQSLIVMVKRRGRTLIPRGNMILAEGDTVYMFTKKKQNPLDVEESDSVDTDE